MKSICLCIAALFLVSVAHAQALTEHAAAAAGAVVGTGGGKVLSNVLDGALNKAASTGTDAVAAPKPKPVETKPAAAPPSATPQPTSTATVSKHARAPRTAPLFPHSEDRMVQTSAALVEPAPAPRLRPSPDDFAKLKEGSPRQDVLATLGMPASHITIPDEGHLLETMTYYDGKRQLGAVRLDNGQVISVTTSPR